MQYQCVCIAQVLRQDIRSATYRGKESIPQHAQVESSSEDDESKNRQNHEQMSGLPTYECRLDVFTVHFKTLNDNIFVESVEAQS